MDGMAIFCRYCAVFVILMTSTASAQLMGVRACSLKADVVFIVDYSNSIWPPYIQTQLQFVVNVTSHLNVGPDGTHVGLVSFSNGARVEVRLDQYTDVARLQAAILAVQQSQYAKTDTFTALRMARQQVLSTYNGARSNVPHIIIIITDGVSSDRRKTVAEANLLRDQGVKVMVVGIGHYLVQEELEEMATARTSTYVHKVTDFTSLSAAMPNVIRSTCQMFSDTTTKPPVLPPVIPTSNGKMDVVFVLDKSASMSASHFRTQLTFVRAVANTFNVHRDHTHVSVVTFDSDAKIEFGLTEHYAKIDLINAIARITYTGGSTISTFRALELVNSRVLTQRGGAREGVARVVIVVTAGTSYHKVATQSAAYYLKWSGTYVFAVGVGGSVDQTELNNIGSQPWSNFVINVHSFSAMSSFQTTLSSRIHRISSADSLVFADDKKADVVFVMDNSADVTAANFRSQLSYVSSLTNMFNVQRDGTHVSVVTFDNDARMAFGLTAYYSISQLSTAIRSIPYSGRSSSSSTFRALQLVISRVLTAGGGARQGVAKVVIVISGGTSRNETATKHWGYQLKWAGAYVFAIGVGRVSEIEMNNVATHPSRQFVLSVDSYQGLVNFRHLQAIRAREVLATELAVFRDDREMDVVFVVDRSASVTSAQFQTQISFISNVINSLYVHRDYAHVSVVTFDNDVKLHFRLSDYTSNSQVLSALRSIAYTGRSTPSTFLALELVTLNVLTARAGARQDVPRTVIVISGGTSLNQTATMYWAYQLKWTGAYVFALGDESAVSPREMATVGSAPSSYFVMDPTSFTSLTDAKNEMIVRAREVPAGTYIASTGDAALPPAYKPVTPATQPIAPADQPVAPGSSSGFGCPMKADVVFIVDYSNSIWPPYIKTQLEFVVNVTSHLNVGPDGSHVGVITFSDGAQTKILLNYYTDVARLQAAILAINQRQNGKTDTFDALRTARQQLFSPSNGARSNVPHIIIIITDGVSSDRRKTVAEANLLRDQGIEVMVVGIGHYLVQEELEEMATARTSTYVHKVTDFTSLNTALPSVISSACKVSDEPKAPVTSAPTTKATPTTVDDTKADVVFVLDRSSSLSSGQFRTQLTFVRDLINTFNVHRDYTHVSVVTFDSDAKIEFGLTEYYTKTELSNAVSRITYTGGSTISTFRALELVNSRVLTQRGGAREGVSRVVIVITGGTSYHKVATQSAAYYLKWSGTYVFAVGAGGSVDKTELNSIGSQPWSNFVFSVDSYSYLYTIRDQLSFRVRQVSTDLSFAFPDDKKADVVFVVDKSADVTATNFRSQLNFVNRVTSMFNVQRDGTHVSVVTFDNDAKVEFGLQDYYSKHLLSNAILRIAYTGRPAVNTFRALELVTTRVLTPLGGARQGVAKVVIFLTGSTSLNETATKYWAYQLKWTTGAYVFAVGVGRNVKDAEIGYIGTHPSRQFVLRMDDYPALANFKHVQAIRAREVLATDVTVFRDDRKMDVVFVVDRSASVTSAEFQAQINFISTVANTLYVHQDYAHVSVVTFDDDAKVEFGLLQYTSNSQLITAIRRIQYTGGPASNSFRALELVATRVLTPGGGAREGVPRVVIVISGGMSRNTTASLYWAYELKWTGAYVFALGVGSDVDPVEMTTVGSQPSSYFAIDVQGYSVLYSMKTQLNLRIREVPPEEIRVPAPSQPVVSGCQTSMDVVFVVDYSTSIHPRYITTELQFVSSVLSQLGVGRDGTHAGLVTFSQGAQAELFLKDTQGMDLRGLQNAVLAITRAQRPRTDTFTALRLAREQVFSLANGARRNVPHIIIILTDGVSSDRRKTLAEANLLRDQGIQVLVVGIGYYLDKVELAEMATANSPTYMHTVYNFTSLTNAFPSLVGSTCKVAKENQPNEKLRDECESEPCLHGGTCTDTLNGYTCQCVPGYTGPLCQTDINECADDPCQNGGTCVDKINGYQCLCVPGYTSQKCETDIDECASKPCQNGGTCKDGVNSYTCACAPGYAGANCGGDVNECEGDPCQNGGTCIDEVNGYKCLCAPGYTDQKCQTDIDECASHPCQNGATCQDKVNGYLCQCVPGFTGQLCQTDINECASKPCQNGGTCKDDVNFYTCLCALGFTGVNCDRDIDECESSPCQNGGTCQDEVNGYKCLCLPGYTGHQCQTDIDDCEGVTCQNGGTCKDGINTYKCQCAPGYTGQHCETDIDDCASKPCQNGGTCKDGVDSYTCLCAPGYSGVNCNGDVDECAGDPCENGGTCVDQVNGYKCICAPGYKDLRCQTDIDDCESKPCLNGGTCQDEVNGYKCLCLPGYTGHQCQTDVDDCEGVTCQNGGTCKDGINTYKCQCAPGYTGQHCETDQVNGYKCICAPGYKDLRCQTDIDDCESKPCLNGGTCRDGVNSYTCVCAPGFSGDNCEKDIDECESAPCQNGATCKDGVNGFQCQCVPGYTGLLCQTDIDDCEKKPCQNGGTCQDGVNSYTCVCAPGFAGVNCDKDINECESAPCQNGATCKDDVNGYKCQCAPGYTGLHCQTDIDDCEKNPCQNGGTCQDGVHSYTCTCAPGFAGVNCDEDIDECESAPCQNGGICKDQVNGYKCQCAPGYTDVQCQTDIDECASKPCQNGGTCQDGVDSYACVCAAGFTGVNCDEDIDDCESKPCQNGGTCKDAVNSYTCVCIVGYTGVNCDEDIDDCEGVTCQNGGTCKDGVNTYKCQCAPGYAGQHCETDIDDCEKKPCQNGGTCTDGVDSYTCQCAPGYAGINCGNDINECESDPCQNGGTCTDVVNGYTCQCTPGYKDLRCQTDIDDCEKKPCQNGGTCTDGVNSYTCTCAPGFTGDNCDEDIDECESNPCQNGATCKDDVNGYQCQCVPGFTDTHCETDIDDCEKKPCQNGGTCQDGVNSYTCDCVPGYAGVNCDEDIDDCEGVTCHNGGTCKDGVDSYKCHCAPGFTGQHCETDIDDCASKPCQNGGTCQDGVDSYTCVCAPGYAGVNCNGDVNECVGDPCQNGGTCVDEVNGYKCLCAPGYKDLRCQTDIDDCEKKPCQNGGTCQDGVNSYTCVCAPGFTGVDCGTDVDECQSDPCQNGGTCTDEVNGYSCQCAPGYTDTTCETDIDDCEKNPCQNGGTCQDGVNSYTCVCAPGFTGVNCDEDIDDCEGVTCQNGGTCKDGVNTYKCQCAPGYSGDHCQIDTDDCSTKPCQNGGTCKDGVDSYTCECVPGYEGVNCEEDVDECEGDPCQNGGTCTDEVNGFKCQCAPGYKDHKCQTDIDDCENKPCQNGGTCQDGVDSYTCVCATGFSGVNCSTDIDDCEGVTCQNGGTCKDGVNSYKCQCAPGYTDQHCETDIDDCERKPCRNGGTCQDGVNSHTCVCAPGFTGVNCDEDIDECESAPCQNGGTCKDRVNGYKCYCAPGYTGLHCQTDIDECDSSPCQNGGTCKDGVDSFTCVCAPGFSGVNCDGDVNECEGDPCQNGGTCVDEVNGYRCDCAPGYKDLRCQTEIDECESGPCLNGATCKDDVNGYKCQCAPGFTGTNCEKDIDECESKPCQNGATCKDDVNGYKCQCAPGFTGTDCETDIDECDSKPCQNGATCKDDVNGYKCQCAPGFTGTDCEKDIDECDSKPCQNGATCKDDVNGYKCQCAPGFTGTNCEKDIDECDSKPCQNGATCKDDVNGYKCQCAPGFTGTNCEKDIDECESDPCQNGATCKDDVNGYKCQCAPGFTGTNCEKDIDECESSPCQNGGTCKDGVDSYTCACPSGYSGVNCDGDVDECEGDPCQNGGTCVDEVNGYTCLCAPGYKDRRCQTNIDDCEKKPCQNGGTCQDGVNSYTCVCAPGFTGVNCSTDIDECESKPCQNGATCKDDVNGYKCQCAPGFTGTDCEIDIDDCASKPCQNGGTCQDGVNSYTCLCTLDYAGDNCDEAPSKDQPAPPGACKLNKDPTDVVFVTDFMYAKPAEVKRTTDLMTTVATDIMAESDVHRFGLVSSKCRRLITTTSNSTSAGGQQEPGLLVEIISRAMEIMTPEPSTTTTSKNATRRLAVVFVHGPIGDVDRATKVVGKAEASGSAPAAGTRFVFVGVGETAEKQQLVQLSTGPSPDRPASALLMDKSGGKVKVTSQDVRTKICEELAK